MTGRTADSGGMDGRAEDHGRIYQSSGGWQPPQRAGGGR